jgi:hypothetical protein
MAVTNYMSCSSTHFLEGTNDYLIGTKVKIKSHRNQNKKSQKSKYSIKHFAVTIIKTNPFI